MADTKPVEEKVPLNGITACIQNPAYIYILIAAFFIFYLVSGVWVFGLLIGLSIVALVLLEFAQGAHEHGIKSELKETAVALILALVVWFGSGFLLQTSSPLNAIVSCSMLPHIQRGDMVVLQGGQISAPHATVSTLANSSLAQIYENGQLVAEEKGSAYSYCSLHLSEPFCSSFISSPEKFTEKHGELTFGYGRCESVYPKTALRQMGPCVQWLEINSVRYHENLSNSVVVYQPEKNEYYSRVGDIIHRAFILITAQDTGKTYFLTRGDNNPIFDVQVYDKVSGGGNRPVEVSRSKGRVILQIPLIGYLKLFISPSAIPTPEGCDRQYAKWG